MKIFTMEGIGIIVFCALVISIGVILSKKAQRSTENFFVSGRDNNVWIIAAGHIMCWVGSGTLVGVYGTSFASKIADAIWYPIGFTLGFLCLRLISN